MKTINVVASIIVHDGRIFATQRGYGQWQGEHLRDVQWLPADETIISEIETIL